MMMPYLPMAPQRSRLTGVINSPGWQCIGGVSKPWPSMPAALTEFPVSNTNASMGRWKVDFTNDRIVQIFGTVTATGTAGAILYLQWSTDQTNWNNFTANKRPQIAIGTSGAKNDTLPLPDGIPRKDLFVRMVGEGGNGATSPQFAPLGAGSGLNRVLADPFQNSLAVYQTQMSGIPFLQIEVNQINNLSPTTATWGSMPAALTEILGTTASRFAGTTPSATWRSRLYGFLRLEVYVLTPGAATAILATQYSLDGGTTWKFLDSETLNTGGPVSIASTGLTVGGCKMDNALMNAMVAGGTNVTFRYVGQGGNGVTSPVFFFGFYHYATRFDPAISG